MSAPSTGVPVAWMLTSSGTEATIKYFLNFVKLRSSQISPAVIMTDRDKAQMNAISAVYPDSTVLLCWWHVLRAIRMHFRTEEFPELWERVREWVKVTDQTKFNSLWEWIQTDPSVPKSFVDYLQNNWMGIVPLWSAIYRKNRSIFQEGDTNMLIEA
jgi:transposase-like protein